MQVQPVLTEAQLLQHPLLPGPVSHGKKNFHDPSQFSVQTEGLVPVEVAVVHENPASIYFD